MMADAGITAKNNDQIALARMAMEANATGPGITDDQCAQLEKGLSPDVYVSMDQCKVLREVLGTGLSAIVTQEERASLRSARFGEYFIAALAGPDGMSAFRLRRAKTAEMASFFSEIWAIRELGQMGPAAKDEKGQVVKVLLTLMERSGREIILECIDALGRIVANDSQSIRALNALRKERDAEIRAASALSLKRIRAGGVEPDSAETVSVGDPRSKQDNTPDPLGDRSVAALLKALSHSDPSVKEAAHRELGRIKAGRLYNELLRCLSQDDPSVRERAVDALGKMSAGDKNALKRIRKLLDDDDPRVKASALKALGALGDSASAARISTTAFSDSNFRVKLAATEALITLGPRAKGAVPILTDILLGTDEADARNAAFILGKIGAVSCPAVPALIRRLNSSDTRLVAGIRAALKEIGAPDARQAEEIAALLENPNFSVRIAAVEALMKMGDKSSSAVPYLIKVLSSGNDDARSAAIFLLGSMGKAAAASLPSLTHIVNGEGEYKERKSAWDSIKNIDPTSGVPEPVKSALPSKPPPAGPPKELEAPFIRVEPEEVIALINRARSEAKQCGDAGFFPAVPPVAWNDMLTEAALRHSVDMASKIYLEHQGMDGSKASNRANAAGYPWRHIGENIALGQRSVQEVVAAWLRSPLHCENIMSPKFDEIGLAYFYGTDVPQNIKNQRAFTYPIYWTLMLGSTKSKD